ncbi:MAG: pyruvate dehydrogenase complex dihydrolipoamide acetyltransferase [Micavibrio aeruginosavorus]|uniref:Acetyltransferase component of pyruvate dehydrogenase complex n=1 Tax=Micavibrio aeruginosavorus TaxID=349221 RepID=A0A2W5N4K9_9BACT|nr:MAG: pyruvate dehydrogenase complex dihydrolipoamide acetyltransferase [Micavibrio aeruginosavorus]
MTIKVLMPALSPTMTEGNLAKWHKKEGDTVKAGEVIAEIETDKATMEVEAVDEGRIGKILVPAGTQAVKVNEPIAILLEDGENDNALKEAGKAETPKVAASPAPAPAAAPVASASPAPAQAPAKNMGSRVFATPLAKRLAREANIDLSKIQGSGPRGRIVKADLQSQNLSPKSSPAGRGPDVAPALSADEKVNAFGMIYTEVPVNNIKKITAKRLVESKSTVPHFYLTIECRIDDLLATRKALNEGGKDKLKISVNDFVVKACAMALKAYPAANVSWNEAGIHQYKHSDISVAVATPNGLMTPIVKQAEGKGLAAISSEIKDLAGRARDGKLKPEEFQGGSFTVSNLGMFGIANFQAIINPPQSCILAVGAGIEKPYVENGEIKIGTFMSCTLSTDHRTVDGAVGAEFLQYVKRFIETPASMLL